MFQNGDCNRDCVQSSLVESSCISARRHQGFQKLQKPSALDRQRRRCKLLLSPALLFLMPPFQSFLQSRRRDTKATDKTSLLPSGAVTRTRQTSQTLHTTVAPAVVVNAKIRTIVIYITFHLRSCLRYET